MIIINTFYTVCTFPAYGFLIMTTNVNVIFLSLNKHM